MYAGAVENMDYNTVATTVFTPLEYSACGLSEEKAIEKYGEDYIEVYHRKFWPLEWTLPGVSQISKKVISHTHICLERRESLLHEGYHNSPRAKRARHRPSLRRT